MKSKNKVWEEAGKVSIWLNVSFDAKNQLIGWFDEDNTESSTLDPNHIFNSLSGSYSGSFKKEAYETAVKLGINAKWNSYFIIYDVSTHMPAGYQLSEKDKAVKGVNADEAATFLGVFDYKK